MPMREMVAGDAYPEVDPYSKRKFTFGAEGDALAVGQRQQVVVVEHGVQRLRSTQGQMRRAWD